MYIDIDLWRQQIFLSWTIQKLRNHQIYIWKRSSFPLWFFQCRERFIRSLFLLWYQLEWKPLKYNKDSSLLLEHYFVAKLRIRLYPEVTIVCLLMVIERCWRSKEGKRMLIFAPTNKVSSSSSFLFLERIPWVTFLTNFHK